MARKPYPSAVSDDEWTFVAPYLTLMTEAAPQREYPVREVLNGLRWMVRAGAPWRMLPNDLPPWEAVSQPTQRWLQAGVFEAMVNDLRQLLRVAAGRKAQPSGAIFESRTLQSVLKAAREPGTMGPHGAKGAKGMGRWIRWATCWRCGSQRPASRTGRKSPTWRPRDLR